MSFTTNQIMNTYQIAEAIDNVQDLQEWMKEDIVSGLVDSTITVNYLKVLKSTEYRLIEFCGSNRIINVQDKDYRIGEDGNMTIIK